MTACPRCGQPTSFWERDLFTWVCPRCRSAGARPASLGCGTLIVIAFIVAMFSRPGLSELEGRVSHLQSSVEELRKASDVQTNEIRELRKTVEQLRGGRTRTREVTPSDKAPKGRRRDLGCQSLPSHRLQRSSRSR